MVGGLPGHLGIELVAFAPCKVRGPATVVEEMLTPLGNAHGGVLVAIVDHITGVVVYLTKPGQRAATTEVKLNYIAPVQIGVWEAESTVLAMTNRSAAYGGDLLPISAR